MAEEQLLWCKSTIDADNTILGQATVRLLLSSLYVDMQQMDSAYAMVSEAISHIDWQSPTAQSMQFFMQIAKLLLADKRPQDAAQFLVYTLQSRLTRESHRQTCEEMRVQLPDGVWETAVSIHPTLTSLHQLATTIF